MWTRVSRLEHVKHCCLSAIGIWVDSKSISIDEVFDSEGIASRTMSVNVSKNDIDRLVSISRSFTSNNEKMRVLFTRVDPVPAHASAHPSSCSFTPGGTLVTASTSPMSNKRSHKSNVTQPRLIKTKLEDALMSGQHDAVAYTGDPTESDLTARTAWTFRNLVIPLVVLLLETLFKHHVLSVVAPLVRKSLFRLSRRQHLVGWLLDLDFQVLRYAVLHVMALKAGLLSNHCENLYNGPNGLVLDGTVSMQQRRLRNAKQTGISKIPKPPSYEEILLWLVPVNCCTALIRRGNAGNWRQLVCCVVTLLRVVQNV